MGKKRDKHESDITDDTTVSKRIKTEPIHDDGTVLTKKIKTEPNDEEQKSLNLSSLNDTAIGELSYDEKIQFTSIIAQPMASRKLAKKLFKLMKKAGKVSKKTLLRVGLKDVQLKIRKGETGLVVFAGDVTPIEVMCHLPAVCEEKSIPYVYVPLRSDISNAVGIKRPALMVMIRHSQVYDDLYRDCETALKNLPFPSGI